jgi:hypothetical protein
MTFRNAKNILDDKPNVVNFLGNYTCQMATTAIKWSGVCVSPSLRPSGPRGMHHSFRHFFQSIVRRTKQSIFHIIIAQVPQSHQYHVNLRATWQDAHDPILLGVVVLWLVDNFFR